MNVHMLHLKLFTQPPLSQRERKLKSLSLPPRLVGETGCLPEQQTKFVTKGRGVRGGSKRIGFKPPLYLLILTVLFISSCTTKPVLPEKNTDPAGVLPAGDDWYLLVRPSGHSELISRLITRFFEQTGSIDSALERTESAVMSGKFSADSVPDVTEGEKGLKLPAFSSSFQGDYPAFWVRNALRKDSAWEKTERAVYRGPGNLVVDTQFRDRFLAVKGDHRLSDLQREFLIPTGARRLPEGIADWWNTGAPALLIYLPDLEAFPLPQGLPALPGGTQADLALLKVESGFYELNLSLTFPDSRSARLWSLGLRFFLAARLGNSPEPEERQAFQELSLKTEESTIRLTGWIMTPEGWARFIDLSQPSPPAPLP